MTPDSKRLARSLSDSDLPPLYHAADKSSLDAQRHLLTATKVRLLGLTGAAFFGLFTWKSATVHADWAGVAAAVCFLAALLSEVFILKTGPDRTWYEGRAAAESVKTLSWRYAVGGEPFNVDLAADHVEDLLLRRLEEVLQMVSALEVRAPSGGEQISAGMRAVRIAPLPERKRVYEEGRVGDQQEWYRRKANWNAARARRWTLAMVAMEFLGISAAVAKALGMVEEDWLGFTGAVVAAAAAWLHVKQHRSLAAAYSVTALELAAVRTRIQRQQTEAEWAMFVDDAEKALSREHTLWKASRVKST